MKKYEAWDKDGLPLQLKIQESVLWLKLNPSSDDHKPEQLRGALLEYAKSVGVQLPNELPEGTFVTVVNQIRGEYEKAKLEKSLTRRFFSRFNRLS